MNNLIALLEECLTNGNLGPEQLYAWFCNESYLIEQAINDANQVNILSDFDDVDE